MLSASAQDRLSPKKIALLHVARKELALSEDDYRAILLRQGGCKSSADLDEIGFERTMSHMNALGFRSDWMEHFFGYRQGMASPAQIAKMRELWTAYHGPDDSEAGLNAWLTKYHKVSALRFVTAKKTTAVMAGLRAMADRKRT